MKGFTGRSGPVMRCPGAAPAGAGAGGATAGVAGRAGGAGAAGATRAAGAGAAAAGARAGGAGDGGGRIVGVGGAAAGAAGGPAGRGGAAGGAAGAATGPEKRGIPGGRGGTGTDGGGGGGAGARGAGDGAAAPAGAAGARGGTAATAGAAAPVTGFTGNTLLHTAQRARTPPGGTLAGSTRYTVSHDGQVTFTLPPVPLPRAAVVELGVVAAVDDEHRPRLSLGVTLHFGRQLAHLCRMGEAAVLVGDDADRQGHQRHAVQLTAAVLAEVVPRPPVLLVVLVRNQRVEHFQHLSAYDRDSVERDDEDEVVSADMPHESTLRQHPFHHVVQDAGQDIDNAIAVIVAVAIVVLLEMI